MRRGYVALFSLFFAYSAYQTIGSRAPQASPKAPKASSASVAHPSADAASPPPAAEPFPTIGGGICRLAISGDKLDPCGKCKAICLAKDFAELIQDYFPPESDSDKKFRTEHWGVPQAAQSKITFVIASLPDPVHTHMALLFDRGIDSIQRAAQASGYLFSRAWMPWDISAHQEASDFTVRLAQQKFRDELEKLPGLMIFQKSGADGSLAPEILFVFVVGETPTGGIHVEQFQNALNIRTSILADAPAKTLSEQQTLRVFGPAFSGSLLSLGAIWNATAQHHFSKLQIRSGTISSYGAVRDFCEATKAEWSRSESGTTATAQSGQNRSLDFATFQFSDKYEEYYVGHFFKINGRDHWHSHLAILSEDETAFGNQEAKSVNPNPPSTQTPDPCPGDPSPAEVPFVRLYFPREIAQLRDAYQQDVKIQQAAESGKSPAQTGLPLSLSVTGNDDDSVATFAPLQTPLSQETIMQAIVETLRSAHAKVVFIRAGDPLDMVFLSRYLRQNYSQARLVTAGADLLMLPPPAFVPCIFIYTSKRFGAASFPPTRDQLKRPARRASPAPRNC